MNPCSLRRRMGEKGPHVVFPGLRLESACLRSPLEKSGVTGDVSWSCDVLFGPLARSAEPRYPTLSVMLWPPGDTKPGNWCLELRCESSACRRLLASPSGVPRGREPYWLVSTTREAGAPSPTWSLCKHMTPVTSGPLSFCHDARQWTSLLALCQKSRFGSRSGGIPTAGLRACELWGAAPRQHSVAE